MALSDGSGRHDAGKSTGIIRPVKAAAVVVVIIVYSVSSLFGHLLVVLLALSAWGLSNGALTVPRRRRVPSRRANADGTDRERPQGPNFAASF